MSEKHKYPWIKKGSKVKVVSIRIAVDASQGDGYIADSIGELMRYATHDPRRSGLYDWQYLVHPEDGEKRKVTRDLYEGDIFDVHRHS